MDEHRRQSEIRTLDQSHSISENLLQLVSFRIGNEEFGLDILRVQEIIRLQDLTRVPNAPDFVDGVINLRGKVIPIIALRKRFGLQQQPHDRQTRIVVLEVQNMCWASLWIRYLKSCEFPPGPWFPRPGSEESSANSFRAWANWRTAC
jgi:chemotaxis signal transduction protein